MKKSACGCRLMNCKGQDEKPLQGEQTMKTTTIETVEKVLDFALDGTVHPATRERHGVRVFITKRVEYMKFGLWHNQWGAATWVVWLQYEAGGDMERLGEYDGKEKALKGVAAFILANGGRYD